jgi:hypothetical protein
MLGYNSSYMFRPNFRAIFKLIFEKVECTIESIINLHSTYSKISLKMALQIEPKHVAGIII